MAALSSAFDLVRTLSEKYLEAPACSRALAAAEVVAALRGKPAKSLPEEVTHWVSENRVDPGQLVQAARTAVDSIARRSELRDLWNESAVPEPWNAVVANLKERLS